MALRQIGTPFGRSLAPRRPGFVDRARAGASYTPPGVPYTPASSTTKAVEQGFRVNPWIYRAVSVMAQNAVSRPIVLRRGDRDEGSAVHPLDDPSNLSRIFNRQAVPWMTSRLMRYQLYAQYLLSSKGVFVEMVANSTMTGWAVADVIDPDRCTLIAGADRPAVAVQVATADRGLSVVPLYGVPTVDGTTPTNVIVWLRSPHPISKVDGLAVIDPASLSADLDNYARLFNRKFILQDGRPGGILSVKGVVDEKQIAILQARFNGGPNAAGETTVIEADTASYTDTAAVARDMSHGETMDRMRKEVAMIFGVPESVMGDASGRCLSEHEYVRLADGSRRKAGELAGAAPFNVLTSTESGQVVAPAWASWAATEPVFEVRTESGRTLTVNAKHPLYAASYTRSVDRPSGHRIFGPKVSPMGWTPVSDLVPHETLIAVPTEFNHQSTSKLTVDEAFVLGALVGDGSISQDRGHVALTTPEGEFPEAFCRSVEAMGDVVTQRHGGTVAEWHVKKSHAHHVRDKNGHCTCRPCLDRGAELARNRRAGIKSAVTVGRPTVTTGVRGLLRRVGLSGTGSHTKFIPNEVFSATPQAQAAFIGGLYAADGYVLKSTIGMTLCNKALVKDVQELLLRLGVSSRIRKHVSHSTSLPQGGTYTGTYWMIDIAARDDVLTFAKQVKIPGKQAKLDALADVKLSTRPVNAWVTTHLDPGLKWEKVSAVTSVGVQRTVAIAVPEHHTYLSMVFEHNSYDNADAEYLQFWQQTMVPFLDSIDDQLDPLTAGPMAGPSGAYNDDLWFRHDTSGVWVLKHHQRAEDDRAFKDWQAGALTLDEYRIATRREPINLAGSRVYWLTPGRLPIGSAQDVAEVSGTAQVGTEQANDPSVAAAMGAVTTAVNDALPAPGDAVGNPLADVASASGQQTNLAAPDNARMRTAVETGPSR